MAKFTKQNYEKNCFSFENIILTKYSTRIMVFINNHQSAMFKPKEIRFNILPWYFVVFCFPFILSILGQGEINLIFLRDCLKMGDNSCNYFVSFRLPRSTSSWRNAI